MSDHSNGIGNETRSKTSATALPIDQFLDSEGKAETNIMETNLKIDLAIANARKGDAKGNLIFKAVVKSLGEGPLGDFYIVSLEFLTRRSVELATSDFNPLVNARIYYHFRFVRVAFTL